MSRTWSKDKNHNPPFPVEKQSLEAKLEAFVRRYRTTYDGPDAARRAGFEAPETVWQELLARKDVQARLRFYRPGVDMPDQSREAVLERLFASAFVDLSNLIWIDPGTGLARYDLRKATSEQLAALEIQETITAGLTPRRTVRIRPRATTIELQALLRHLGLQDVQTEQRLSLDDMFKQAGLVPQSMPIANERDSWGAEG
jgi:hypothetical protein